MSTASDGGRAQLEAIRDGRAPVVPIQRVLEVDLTHVADGRVVAHGTSTCLIRGGR